MRKISSHDRDRLIAAKIYRNGEMIKLDESSIEKKLAGNVALDAYALRAVTCDPDVYYGYIVYMDNATAYRRINTLRGQAYHKDYPVFCGLRGRVVYLIKAVDLDG